MTASDSTSLIQRGRGGQINVMIDFADGGGVYLRGLFSTEAKAAAWIRQVNLCRVAGVNARSSMPGSFQE